MNSQDNQSVSAIDGTSWGVLIGIVLLAAIFWLVMTRSVPRPESHPAVGRPAPELDLVQLIPGQLREAEWPEQGEAEQVGPAPGQAPGGSITLTGLPAEGVVTLLHFWGTWCPPCRLEYPELVEMVQSLESEPRFQFVTVSCDGGGPEDFGTLQMETADYYRSIGAGELVTFADLNGQTRRWVAQQLDESIMYPTTILIAPDQRIAAVWLGYSPAGVSQMQQSINELLK